MFKYAQTKLTFTAKLWEHDNQRDPKYELQLIGVFNNKDVAYKNYSATGHESFSIRNQASSRPPKTYGRLQADFPIPSNAKTEYWPATVELDEKIYNLKFVYCGRHNDHSDLYVAAFVEM